MVWFGLDLLLLGPGHVVAPVHAVEEGEGGREEHPGEHVDLFGLELEVLDVVLHPAAQEDTVGT